YSPGGTVTFRLYGPDDSSCTGGIAFEDTEAVAGAGAESTEFAPTAAGTYRWTAEYSGDSDNSAATDGCNGADESVTVAQPSPTISISFPPDKEHFALHQNVTPGYSCSEPLGGSSAASCTATPIDTSTLGPHLFTVTAVDKFGNESTKTVTYVVDPPRYGEFVLEDHPLAYYRLDEPLGSGRMLDSSGNGHDGEYKNGVVLRRAAAIACERRPHPPHACELTNDPQDWSAYFPPRDGYGYANGITAPTQAYSIEAWVKPTDGQDMMIAAHGGGGQLFISGGHLAFRQTQDTIVASGADGVVPPGRWSYVAATWDGHISRLYVDGHEVDSANWANKEPSGSATFYVGYGDQAPWFHGYEDEVAYYGHALSAGRIFDRWQIGTAYDHPSPTGPGTSQTGPENTDTAIPYANIEVPVNDGTYAPTKVPNSSFDCTDPDGPGDIASCEAELDGTSITSGAPLPQTPGVYHLTLVATDIGGNVYTHTHTFTVEPYADVVRSDDPIAYYRLGDTGDTMADSSGNGHDGTYKNDTESGPVGISGDGDHARLFKGEGGYGYVDGITAPTDESSLEAWVHPFDGRDEAIVGHGDAGELDIIGGHFSYRRMETTLTAQIGPGGHCVAPTPGVWTHVVGTWDGVTMRIYVDGELCGEVESTRRPSSSSTFYVGFGQLAPWFYGAIDEVAYYPTALSAERVHEHYIADPPPAELDAVEAVAAGGGEASSAGGEASGAGGSSSVATGATGGGTSDTAPAGADGAAPSPGPTVTKKSRCARRKGKARKVCLKRAGGLRRHR
ncbi:MAG TPA: LamG-like jellyroll fold domain-containing protein, partial [Solirubrobacterales bacterium]|nr:LamG-like jellyroll fold domain-containing protein [Solirubrobacterales bacterium]